MNGLWVRNRQRRHALDVKLLRRITGTCLSEIPGLEQFEIGVYLVGTPEIIRLNEQYLRHSGTTDVITFDYADPSAIRQLQGEIFICVDEAVANARRFQVRWPTEVVRCTVHGLLHLQGYRDDNPRHRRRMKREENRLLRGLGRRFNLSHLAV